jgi:DNA-binding GntR family transcriptional regulator
MVLTVEVIAELTETPQTINRDSYEPAYAQIVRLLRQQISSGQFRPGNQLPSESAICSLYGVSPMTVRRAINILLDQGLVTTVQGRGTFVKGLELGSSTFALDELQDIFRDKEHSKVQLLRTRIVPASEGVAHALAIPPGAKVIYIRRLLLKNDDPILCHEEHLVYDPTRPVVEAEMDVTSLHGLFSGTGETDIKRGFLVIKSALLDAESAALLRAKPSTPAFRLEHTFFDFNNQPVSFGYFICSSDRLKFCARVGIWD